MAEPNPSHVAPWYLRNITQALALDEATGTVYVRTNTTLAGNVSVGNVAIGSLGNVNISGNTLPVSGNVSVGNVAIGSLGNVNIWGNTLPVSGNVNANVTSIGNVVISGNTMPVSGNVDANVTGTVVATQGTTPWVTTANISGTVPVTFPDATTTAFEELMVVQPYPMVQLDATYGLETDKIITTEIGSGTAGATSDALWYVDSGTTAGAVASLSSRRFVRYRPGTGTMARFTASYTVSTGSYGITGVTQQAGLQNAGSAYAFGFSGLSGNQAGTNSDQRQFGILHRRGGRVEIRTLTITQAPTGAQTVTLILNGVTYTKAIVAESASQLAQQITQIDFGGVWYADQVDGTVVFTAKVSGPKSGSYSFSSAGSGTLATGTIAQTAAGVANTNEWTYIDKWDNPITFDPTMLNVFAVDMRWLGAGIVRFFIEHPTTGKMTLVHTQHWANKHTIPHVNMPSFRVGYATGVLAGSTPAQAAQVKGASLFAGIQGGIAQTTYSEGWYNVNTGNQAKDLTHHLISVKNPYSKNLTINTREFVLQDLSVSIQGTDPAVIFVYINPTVATGQVLFDTIPDSTAVVSTTSSPTFDPTQNNPVCSFVLGINGTSQFDLLPYRLVLSPGDVLSVAFLSTNGITRTAVSLTWATD